jgi:hypothetical protein
MKRTIIPIVVGLSIALVSLVGVPAYGGHGGGGHAGFSGGAHFGGAGRGYSAVGISHAAGSMVRGIIRPESPRDATAAIAAMGKDTTYREAQPEPRFMVPARDRKVESLPISLLGRQLIPVATTSREIGPGLALLANLTSSNAPA